MQRLWDRQSYSSVSTHRSRIPRLLRNAQTWNPRRLLSLPHLFVAIWALVLLWGERWAFKSAIEACEWGKWERWVGSSYSVNEDRERCVLMNGIIAKGRNAAPSGLHRGSATH
jgi:hypothetical protein